MEFLAVNDWTKQELVDVITAHEHTAYIDEQTGDIMTTVWIDPPFTSGWAIDMLNPFKAKARRAAQLAAWKQATQRATIHAAVLRYTQRSN